MIVNWFPLILGILNMLLGLLILVGANGEEKYPHQNLIATIMGFLVSGAGAYLSCYALGWMVNS